MNKFSMNDDRQGSILTVGDRQINLQIPHQFRGCQASPDGAITCTDIFEAEGHGCYQILTYRDDQWCLDRVKVDLMGLDFHMASRGGKLYCSLLTQKALLKEVFDQVRLIGGDAGFVGSDHTDYIAHIKTFPSNALDTRINKDWHRKQDDKN